MNLDLLNEISRDLGYLDLIILVLIIVFFSVRKSFRIWLNIFNWIRDKFSKDEKILIIGYTTKSLLLLKDAIKKGRKVILVTDKQPKFNDEFSQNKILVIKKNLFKKIRINSFSYCIILSDSDEYNLEITQKIIEKKRLTSKNKFLKLIVSIENENLRNILIDQKSENNFNIETVYFSYNQLLSTALYESFPPQNFLRDNTSKNKRKTIAIVGYNEIAKEFISENAILSQLSSNPINLICIFKNSEKIISEIELKYPGIGELINFLPVELLSESFNPLLKWDENLSKNIYNIDIAYFFGNNDSLLIETAIRFKQFIYNKTGNIKNVISVVALLQNNNLLELINFGKGTTEGTLFDRYKENLSINIVKLLDDFCNVDKLIGNDITIDIAKITNYYYFIKYKLNHKISKFNNKHKNDKFIESLISSFLNIEIISGNHMQCLEENILHMIKTYTNSSTLDVTQQYSVESAWREISQREKQSNLYVARHLSTKLKLLDELNLKSITSKEIKKHKTLLSSIEHNRWIAEKIIGGYVFGEMKNANRDLKQILKTNLKIHDQLKPFESLTTKEKNKDLDMFILIPLFKKIISSSINKNEI